ncbi:MAG: thioesterase domain-containing protein [Gammaproteobacteria bacterium]|jgi:thioesterase domain-containing protein
MTDRMQALQHTLHHEIPLTRAIGIKVTDVTHDAVTLTAPLENNLNHKATAFGGSLYSVAVLAGWSLIHSRLHELGLAAHIVIQESDIRYLQPVTQDIVATARIESEAGFEKFVRLFRKKGMARISLNAEIGGADGPAVRFQGRYVIHT